MTEGVEDLAIETVRILVLGIVIEPHADGAVEGIAMFGAGGIDCALDHGIERQGRGNGGGGSDVECVGRGRSRRGRNGQQMGTGLRQVHDEVLPERRRGKRVVVRAIKRPNGTRGWSEAVDREAFTEVALDEIQLGFASRFELVAHGLVQSQWQDGWCGEIQQAESASAGVGGVSSDDHGVSAGHAQRNRSEIGVDAVNLENGGAVRAEQPGVEVDRIGAEFVQIEALTHRTVEGETKLRASRGQRRFDFLAQRQGRRDRGGGDHFEPVGERGIHVAGHDEAVGAGLGQGQGEVRSEIGQTERPIVRAEHGPSGRPRRELGVEEESLAGDAEEAVELRFPGEIESSVDGCIEGECDGGFEGEIKQAKAVMDDGIGAAMHEQMMRSRLGEIEQAGVVVLPPPRGVDDSSGRRNQLEIDLARWCFDQIEVKALAGCAFEAEDLGRSWWVDGSTRVGARVERDRGRREIEQLHRVRTRAVGVGGADFEGVTPRERECDRSKVRQAPGGEYDLAVGGAELGPEPGGVPAEGIEVNDGAGGCGVVIEVGFSGLEGAGVNDIEAGGETTRVADEGCADLKVQRPGGVGSALNEKPVWAGNRQGNLAQVRSRCPHHRASGRTGRADSRSPVTDSQPRFRIGTVDRRSR